MTLIPKHLTRVLGCILVSYDKIFTNFAEVSCLYTVYNICVNLLPCMLMLCTCMAHRDVRKIRLHALEMENASKCISWTIHKRSLWLSDVHTLSCRLTGFMVLTVRF